MKPQTLRAGCDRRFQKEEGSLEPTTVFLAQPRTCSGVDPGPGTGDIESTARPSPALQGHTSWQGRQTGKQTVKIRDLQKHRLRAPSPDHSSPLQGLPYFCLCFQSRARRVSPGRWQSLPGEVETVNRGAFGSSQPCLGGW